MSRSKRSIPLFRLAWRNTRRHTRRTLLTATAVAVAVAALTFGPAYIDGILANMVDTYARMESGHVRIRKEGYSERERFMPVHMNVRHISELLPVIRTHAAVEEALPRIRSAVLVDRDGSNRPGLLLGIDLAREENYLRPAAMLTEGRLPEPGQAEVLLGAGFAEKLQASPGDTLTLLGQTSYRSLGGLTLVITGLASSGVAYLDNSLLIVSIDQAQLMVDLPDGATEILVFAREQDQAEALAAALNSELDLLVPGGLEVLPWNALGSIIRIVETARPIFNFIFVIMLLMASLIIVNTMLMTVMERTQEFGMESALGMRRSDIVAMVLAEGLVIGLLGGIVGGVFGTGVSVWLESTGINITQATRGIEIPFQGMVYPDWKAIHTFSGIVIGMITAVAATIYPAWRAVRMSPAEALRS